jgi:hypothetical protein
VTVVLQLAISRDVLLTSNQRVHYMKKARHTKTIRELAYLTARGQRPPKMQAATCEVEVTWPDRRERDCLNLEPTLKACFDGIIGDSRHPLSYQLLPSDSDRHLRSVKTYAADRTHRRAGIACFLTFRFTPLTGSGVAPSAPDGRDGETRVPATPEPKPLGDS